MASVRVERTGPGGVVARVTLARPDVHNAFDATSSRSCGRRSPRLAREDPTQLRAVVLAGEGPSFCAGADLAWMRAAMALDTEGERAGRDGHGRHVRGHRYLPGAGHRPRPRRGARGRDGAVRRGRSRHRRERRRGSGSPRRGWGSCRRSSARSSSPRSARATHARCSRAGAGSMRRGRPGSGWSTRSSRATPRWTPRSRRAVADLLAAGPTAARAAKAIVREVRGLGHGSAKWHTARVIARQRTTEEAQEGFRAFTEKRRPAWAPDPRTDPPVARRGRLCDDRDSDMSEELSPSQAAALIGTTTRSVQRWIASGRLPARRVGGRWRVAI